VCLAVGVTLSLTPGSSRATGALAAFPLRDDEELQPPSLSTDEQDVGADGELRALLDDLVSRAENSGSSLLVLVIVALMVLKP